MPLLFVYGTLKKNGLANHLLGGSKFITTERIKGYALYDYYGYYPFAIYTSQPTDFIVGEFYEVQEKDLVKLDDYEGEMYEKYFDTTGQFYIYLKKNGRHEDFKKIESGDWFEYIAT